jgi:hypothetical protein
MQAAYETWASFDSFKATGRLSLSLSKKLDPNHKRNTAMKDANLEKFSYFNSKLV